MSDDIRFNLKCPLWVESRRLANQLRNSRLGVLRYRPKADIHDAEIDGNIIIAISVKISI